MKGIILAGGMGTRLKPMTEITNKHLLPVFDRPMIEFPLRTLKEADITDVMIVTGPEHAGDFMKYLGSGKDHGIELTYRLQDEAGGIAQALSLARNFVGDSKCAVILGDNIIDESIREHSIGFDADGEAMIFLKEVEDPQRFGVAEVKDGRVVGIEEKPKHPRSKLAVIGLYLYDSSVFRVVRDLKPSWRNELEVTDVNNYYVQKGVMRYSTIHGFWSDAGTIPSLFRAAKHIEENSSKKS